MITEIPKELAHMAIDDSKYMATIVKYQIK